MRSLVKKAGGVYSGDLVAGKTSVLVQAPSSVSQHTQKIRKAICWNIPVVNGTWLADSHRAKVKKAFQRYMCHDAKTPAASQQSGKILPSSNIRSRQALQDRTNLLQSSNQQVFSTLVQGMPGGMTLSARNVEEPWQVNQHSCTQDFEPPDIELSRRAVTTRQERPWRHSLSSVSSPEEQQPQLREQPDKMAKGAIRPPSPSPSSSAQTCSTDSPIPAGLISDESSAENLASKPSQAEHGLADSGCSLHSRELFRANALVDVPRLQASTLEPGCEASNQHHHRRSLPEKQMPACSLEIGIQAAIEPHEQHQGYASAETPLPQAGNAFSLMLNSTQVPSSKANTAPQPRISQLPLENVTSRKQHRPATNDALSAAESAMLRESSEMKYGPPDATATPAASSSLRPGVSSPAGMMSGLSISSAGPAGSSAASAREATVVYPEDGKVQPLRMLGPPSQREHCPDLSWAEAHQRCSVC